MHCYVLVTFLKTTVFRNVVQVVSSDNNGSLHLSRDDKSLKNTAANRDVACEWAFLVYIIPFDSGSGGFNSETYRLGESHSLGALDADSALASHKDCILLLVSLFILITLDVLFRDARHD